MWFSQLAKEKAVRRDTWRGGMSITFATIYFFIKHGGKGLAPQAWGPEFGSPEPTWKLGRCDVIPALRWWRQGKPMSKQASNYSISKCWVGLRDPASVNKKRVITDVNLMSLHALTHTHTHANTYILTIHMCTYTYQRRTCIERIPWSWKPRTQQVHSVPLQFSVCLNWFEQRQYSQVKIVHTCYPCTLYTEAGESGVPGLYSKTMPQKK